jgi:hypothetical protein
MLMNSAAISGGKFSTMSFKSRGGPVTLASAAAVDGDSGGAVNVTGAVAVDIAGAVSVVVAGSVAVDIAGAVAVAIAVTGGQFS